MIVEPPLSTGEQMSVNDPFRSLRRPEAVVENSPLLPYLAEQHVQWSPGDGQETFEVLPAKDPARER